MTDRIATGARLLRTDAAGEDDEEEDDDAGDAKTTARVSRNRDCV